MTPTDTIIALEKALEAGPTAKAEWVAKGSEVWVGQRRICSHVMAGESMGMGPAIERERVNAQWIAATNPLAIRTLLDAHASALRDAAKLRAKLDALDNLPAEEFIRKIARQMGPPPFDTWPVSHVCQQNADEAVELVAEYDRLAALDDNTKGTAE